MYSVRRIILPALAAAGFLLECLVLIGCDGGSHQMQSLMSVFTPVGAMVEPREFHTAVRLQNGRVLIAGGIGSNLPVEIYNPEKFAFSSLGLSGLLREDVVAVLNDNTVLLVDCCTQSAVLLDATMGAYTTTGSPVVARIQPVFVKLSDGRVLIVGGIDATSNLEANSAEIYDPAKREFSLTGNPASAGAQRGVLLLDGRVLLIGPDAAQIFDPATGTFFPTGHTTSSRSQFTATTLTNGKVLVAGGLFGTTVLDTAELYDPATGSFAPIGSMGQPHAAHTAVALADGRVLVAGGPKDVSEAVKNLPTKQACVYDLGSNMFTSTADMTVQRERHSMTLLQDGTVLVAGGNRPPSADAPNPSAELYQ